MRAKNVKFHEGARAQDRSGTRLAIRRAFVPPAAADLRRPQRLPFGAVRVARTARRGDSCSRQTCI
ncbi:hypothetical protein BOC52_24255 [Burkholderia pseudomallei]|nr:hypothetical protein BOC52_24255 [Burkholderia pseudomallei]ARL66003.1 hypothetical protein BOC53_21345 [Burkholderia pseudomallei]